MSDDITPTTCKYKNKATGWQCPRPALTDSADGFCICHEQKDEKDEALFRKEIDEIVKKAGEEDCHFDGFYFPYKMDFSEIVFYNNVYFNDAEFINDCKFGATRFAGRETCFNKAIFLGAVIDFSHTQFLGEFTSFNHAKFSVENITFNEAIFWSEINNFEFVNFSAKMISFYQVRFTSGSPMFRGKPIFERIFYFEQSEYTTEWTSFDYAIFSDDLTSFEECNFGGETTSFNNSRFNSDKTLFYRAVFLSSWISFREVEFNGMIADFSGSSMSRHLLLYRVVFNCNVNNIRDIYFEISAVLEFDIVTVDEKNRNDLRDLDMSRCLFRETNLEYCDVSLVPINWNWKLLNESLSNEAYKSLVDEAPHVRFNHAADSYRRLKVNFIKRQDYNKAAICNYREWECTRKSSKFALYKNWVDFKSTFLKNNIHEGANSKNRFKDFRYLTRSSLMLLFLYGLKRSCGYGEKLQNVFASIAAIIFFCPFLFIIPGFQLCPDSDHFTPQVGIIQWWGESVVTHWWWGFKHTFFNFFPLWRLDDVRACTDPARLATGFIALLGAFMIGMFIYVFRRRLMR
jgi:uncharacterized protein YjbI with pentapeptide repeats